MGTRCQLIDQQPSIALKKEFDAQQTNDIQFFENRPRSLDCVSSYAFVYGCWYDRHQEFDFDSTFSISGPVGENCFFRSPCPDDREPRPLKVDTSLRREFPLPVPRPMRLLPAAEFRLFVFPFRRSRRPSVSARQENMPSSWGSGLEILRNFNISEKSNRGRIPMRHRVTISPAQRSPWCTRTVPSGDPERTSAAAFAVITRTSRTSNVTHADALRNWDQFPGPGTGP